MSILPLSFSANKVGYKKYLKSGGGLLFADFIAYERRTAKEILAEKINRFHSAMIYSYDQSVYYKSIENVNMYELHTYTCEVRAKQLGEVHQELRELEVQEEFNGIY
jgi:hypothetical protein